MRIACCDDESFENDNLCALIEAYAQKKNYDIRCFKFTSGEALLKEDKFDLYFLDFLMDEMDGIALAKGLKAKFNGAVTVCYLTNFEDAAGRIINQQVYADGFLKKPVAPEQLYEKLDKFYKTSSEGRLELKAGRGFITVYTRDVLYAEASAKQTVIHLAGGKTEVCSHMLQEMEQLLLPYRCFYRIHRSFIVNLAAVSGYDIRSVTLINGETLPLKARDFQKAFREYNFEQMK